MTNNAQNSFLSCRSKQLESKFAIGIAFTTKICCHCRCFPVPITAPTRHCNNTTTRNGWWIVSILCCCCHSHRLIVALNRYYLFIFCCHHSLFSSCQHQHQSSSSCCCCCCQWMLSTNLFCSCCHCECFSYCHRECFHMLPMPPPLPHTVASANATAIFIACSLVVITA